MSRKIPHEIKVNVIQLWLQGFSRNYIAEIVGIGKGTVTGIIQNTRLTMNDVDLLRAVGESSYKEGVDIYTFASAINLKRKIDESGWSQESIEWFLEELEKIGFKKEIDSKVLLDMLMNILNLSNNFNISIEDAKYFLEGFMGKKEELETEVLNKKAELDQVRQDVCTEIEDSNDYKRYKNWKEERLSLINSNKKYVLRISELEARNSELNRNANNNQDSRLPAEKFYRKIKG